MLLIAYAVVAAVSVLALAVGVRPVAASTTALLMPLLAAYLVSDSARPFHRMVRLVLGALALFWLGDLLLETSRSAGSDALYLAGMGAYLVALVLYIVALTPVVRSGDPPRPPLWALLYVPYGAVLVGAVGSSLGSLLLAVAVFTVAVFTMAIVASGINVWTAVGAAAFVLSTSLMMMGDLADALPFASEWQRALVTSTYALAQGLIVHGVVVEQRLIWAKDVADEE